MIQIKNLQNLKRINQAKFYSITRKILKYLNLTDKSVSLVFCDNNIMKDLNRRYFKRNTSTDVVSFCLQDKFSPSFLGEIVVSVEEALKNTNRYKTTLSRELVLYVAHGILHLIGYKDYNKRDREKMEAKQDEILAHLYGGSK